MRLFTDIETFRHCVASVKRYCEAKGKPIPSAVKYIGTVKLHGTNAGVHVTPEKVQPLKRSDICTVEHDNAGFAAFCHGRQELFRKIAKPYGKDFTIFGEWCGGNIQNQGNLALKALEKHFVIFSALGVAEDGSEHWYNAYDVQYELHTFLKELNDVGIWCVAQISPYYITVDFTRPETVLGELERLTLEVENECPWGKFRGVSGVGEGIVWMPTDFELQNVTGLWFKTKGMKHAEKDPNKKGKTNIQAAPEKIESIRELVALVLPEWRLAQGISVMKADNLEIIPENTGEFLKWIAKDVLKEETDRIVANDLTWKDIQGYIMRDARTYYLNQVNKEAFPSE